MMMRRSLCRRPRCTTITYCRLLVVLLSHAVAVVSAQPQDNVHDNDDTTTKTAAVEIGLSGESSTNHVDVTSWLCQEQGGWVNDKITFDRARGGMFALDDIAQGEVLFDIPPRALIYQRPKERTTASSTKIPYDYCGLTERLAEEYYDQHAQSNYYPFLRHVFEIYPHAQLPLAWSPAGLALLGQIEGDELQSVVQEYDWGSYYESCIDPDNAAHVEYYQAYHDNGSGGSDNGSDSDDSNDNHHPNVNNGLEIAWRIMAARSWYTEFVPVYDQVNHRNGDQWHNVERTMKPEEDADPDRDGDDSSDTTTDDTNDNASNNNNNPTGYWITAKRDILAGEQLYNSYNHCNSHEPSCHGIYDTFVTPQIFRAYGFVEQYPRRFSFPMVNNDNDDDAVTTTRLAWELDCNEDDDDNKEPPAKNCTVTWITDQPPATPQEYQWLQRFHARLQRIHDETIQSATALSAEYERRLVLEFYDALYEAVEQALQQFPKLDDSNEASEEEEEGEEEARSAIPTTTTATTSCNCDEQVQKALAALQSETTALQQQLAAAQEELRVANHVKDSLSKSIAALGQAKDAELKTTKMTLSSVQRELAGTKAQLKQQSDTTFVKQFEKEVTELYQQVVGAFT